MKRHLSPMSGQLLLIACLTAIFMLPPMYGLAQEPAAASEAVETAAEETASTYVYQPRGRRDPFTPLVQRDDPATIVKTARRPEELRGPLERFELRQLRLIAVMVVQGIPRAMVAAPDGKSYTVKVDDYIGLDGGRVKDIQTRVQEVDATGMRVEKHPDRIVVEEVGVDSMTGNRVKEDRYIVL